MCWIGIFYSEYTERRNFEIVIKGIFAHTPLKFWSIDVSLLTGRIETYLSYCRTVQLFVVKNCIIK